LDGCHLGGGVAAAPLVFLDPRAFARAEDARFQQRCFSAAEVCARARAARARLQRHNRCAQTRISAPRAPRAPRCLQHEDHAALNRGAQRARAAPRAPLQRHHGASESEESAARRGEPKKTRHGTGGGV
jgi:hypothetical protein